MFDLVFSALQIICYRNGTEFAGMVFLSFSEIQAAVHRGQKLQWHELTKQQPSDEVTGELYLSVDIVDIQKAKTSDK